MKKIIKYAILAIFVIIVMFVMIASLADFQRARKVLINDSEKVTTNFDNNKIETTSKLFSQWILDYHSSMFYLYMKYYLEDEITIHRNGIHIECNGKTIEWIQLHNIDSNYKSLSFKNISPDIAMKVMESRIIWVPDYKLSGNGHLALPFSISDDIEVKKGDKIKITAPGFITYNRDTVSLDEMTLEIGKFFR